jgi:hypothetical protein
VPLLTFRTVQRFLHGLLLILKSFLVADRSIDRESSAPRSTAGQAQYFDSQALSAFAELRFLRASADTPKLADRSSGNQVHPAGPLANGQCFDSQALGADFWNGFNWARPPHLVYSKAFWWLTGPSGIKCVPLDCWQRSML